MPQKVLEANKGFFAQRQACEPWQYGGKLFWLAAYDRETRRKAESDPAPKPIGHFGENEYDVADFAGNVREWTTTCQRRVDLAEKSIVCANAA